MQKYLNAQLYKYYLRSNIQPTSTYFTAIILVRHD